MLNLKYIAFLKCVTECDEERTNYIMSVYSICMWLCVCVCSYLCVHS